MILEIASLLDIGNDEEGEEEKIYTCFEFLHEELEERKADLKVPKFKSSQVWGLRMDQKKRAK